MKHLTFPALLLLLCVFTFIQHAHAQFSEVAVQETDLPGLKIVQIDQFEESTVIHFTYRSFMEDSFNGSETIYLTERGNENEYRLLNSYNLPLDRRVNMFGNNTGDLNFSLEFEKISLATPFDINGGDHPSFNQKGITVDTTIKQPYMDLERFISKTPSREFYILFHEGSPVLRFAYKGVIIAVKLVKDETYGRHFQPHVIIQNYTTKDILFDPELIIAQWRVGEKYYKAPIIQHQSYIKRVKTIQKKEERLVAFSEGLAAALAGFSSISTTSNAYATAYGSSVGLGYIGNIPIGAVTSSSTHAYAQVNTSASYFDGGAAYMAGQQARANVAAYRTQSVQQLKALNAGYAKKNTIPPNTEYASFFNIPYERNANILQIRFTLEKEDFLFEWDAEMLNDLVSF